MFTPSELAAYRQRVQQRVAQEEEKLGRLIMWRPTQSHRGEEEEDEDHEPLRLPPFAVIASNHTDLAVGRLVPYPSRMTPYLT